VRVRRSGSGQRVVVVVDLGAFIVIGISAMLFFGGVLVEIYYG